MYVPAENWMLGQYTHRSIHIYMCMYVNIYLYTHIDVYIYICI